MFKKTIPKQTKNSESYTNNRMDVKIRTLQ